MACPIFTDLLSIFALFFGNVRGSFGKDSNWTVLLGFWWLENESRMDIVQLYLFWGVEIVDTPPPPTEITMD